MRIVQHHSPPCCEFVNWNGGLATSSKAMPKSLWCTLHHKPCLPQIFQSQRHKFSLSPIMRPPQKQKRIALWLAAVAGSKKSMLQLTDQQLKPDFSNCAQVHLWAWWMHLVHQHFGSDLMFPLSEWTGCWTPTGSRRLQGSMVHCGIALFPLLFASCSSWIVIWA